MRPTHNRNDRGSSPFGPTKYMSNNPLTAILDILPYTKAVLDVNLSDELRNIIKNKTKKTVSDSAILLVLLELHKSGLVELEYIEPIDAVGRIHFIKKVLNGK